MCVCVVTSERERESVCESVTSAQQKPSLERERAGELELKSRTLTLSVVRAVGSMSSGSSSSRPARTCEPSRRSPRVRSTMQAGRTSGLVVPSGQLGGA